MTLPLNLVLLKWGGVLSGVGVAASAYGAHSTKLGEYQHRWVTAAHYAMVHGIAVIALSQFPARSKQLSAATIALGASCFSGILLLNIATDLKFKALGPLAPIGGVLMITGYLSLLL